MSRGISWRQRRMLQSIAKQTMREESVRVEGKIAYQFERPVAWRDLDPNLDYVSDKQKYRTANGQWNHEQTVRRALRSLEQRGLVELGSYSFSTDITDNNELTWAYQRPDHHNPSSGYDRWMTGALLTEAGWALVKAEEARQPAAEEPPPAKPEASTETPPAPFSAG